MQSQMVKRGWGEDKGEHSRGDEGIERLEVRGNCGRKREEQGGWAIRRQTDGKWKRKKIQRDKFSRPSGKHTRIRSSKSFQVSGGVLVIRDFARLDGNFDFARIAYENKGKTVRNTFSRQEEGIEQ